MIPAMRRLALPLVFLLTACSRPPQSFSMGQQIPVGTVTITATGSSLTQVGDLRARCTPK